MKFRLEINPELEDDEIVLHCRELNDEVLRLQARIQSATASGSVLPVEIGDTQYYLRIHEILFFETTGTRVAAHTTNQVYTTKQRLYELESALPSSFMRVSKSTIVNTAQIRAIHKNITGASELEFKNSTHTAYASRNYINELLNKLEEKRLRHE